MLKYKSMLNSLIRPTNWTLRRGYACFVEHLIFQSFKKLNSLFDIHHLQERLTLSLEIS